MNPKSLTKRLALSIESRGRDATGYAYAGVDDWEGQVMLHKLPIPASTFTTHGHHNPVQRGTSTVLIHTRAATAGSPSDNNNNHPIVVQPRGDAPGIVGTHNGVLWNDTDLWRHHQDLFNERQGEVDSQLIFQILSRQGYQALSQLEGDASIAWVDMAAPTELQVARMGGRPLVALTTEGGSFFYASTSEALLWSLSHFSQLGSYTAQDVIDMDPGDWVTVKDGEIIGTRTDFPVITLARTYKNAATAGRWYDNNWDTPPQGGALLPFAMTETDKATWAASMEPDEPAGSDAGSGLLEFDREFFHELTQGVFVGVDIDDDVIEAVADLAYSKGDPATVDEIVERICRSDNQKGTTP